MGLGCLGWPHGGLLLGGHGVGRACLDGEMGVGTPALGQISFVGERGGEIVQKEGAAGLWGDQCRCTIPCRGPLPGKYVN